MVVLLQSIVMEDEKDFSGALEPKVAIAFDW